MIYGNLDQFLDNGWEHDVILFYNGFYYYCNGSFDNMENHMFQYSVFKARGFINQGYLCSYYMYNGELVDCEDVFQETNKDEQLVKKHFFEAKIFDGKSFWEVEKDLVWGEDDNPKIIKSLSEIEEYDKQQKN